jgi:hypothetical protein
MSEEFTTLNKIHDEEHSILILIDIVHADKEWVINVKENLLLKLEGVNVLIL